MKLYKLTNRCHQTRNFTQWGEGVEHTAPGGDGMCNKNWLHAYTDPYLAVLMNPLHAAIIDPVLWEAEGDVGTDNGTKVGCTRLKTIKQIPLPEITTEQRVLFAIECARKVCDDPYWNAWADRWVGGEDRTRTSAVYACSSTCSTAPSSEWLTAMAAASAASAKILESCSAAEAADFAAEAATMASLRVDLLQIVRKVFK